MRGGTELPESKVTKKGVTAGCRGEFNSQDKAENMQFCNKNCYIEKKEYGNYKR